MPQQARVRATPPVCSCDTLRSEVTKPAMPPWSTDSRVESAQFSSNITCKHTKNLNGMLCMSVATVRHVYVEVYKRPVIHSIANSSQSRSCFLLSLYKYTVTAQCLVSILGLELFEQSSSSTSDRGWPLPLTNNGPIKSPEFEFKRGTERESTAYSPTRDQVLIVHWGFSLCTLVIYGKIW